MVRVMPRCPDRGGAAMTTALRSGEWDVLPEDGHPPLSRLQHAADAPPPRRPRAAPAPPPAPTVARLERASALRAELEQRTRELAAANEELRHLINAIPHAIAILGPDGRTLFANAFALDYTGLSLEE